MSELSYIQIERRPNDIAMITINRLEVLNAINVDVITELASAIDTVSADDGIKVVIITGRGERSFCAGADIRYVVNINPHWATLLYVILLYTLYYCILIIII